MKNLTPVLVIVAAGVIGSVPGSTLAAPITYDFTGPSVGTNVDLGQSEPYTASGGPTITAMAGTYFGSSPVANNADFNTASGVHLVGNDRGSDEQGVGVCGTSSGNCNGSHLTGENGEIDFGGREVVRLDITSLFSTFGNFQINADSATGGEMLGSFRATQRQPSAQSSQTSPVLRIMSVLPRRAIISTSSLIPTTVAEMLCCIYLPSRPILSRSPLALLLLGPQSSDLV